MGRNEIRLRRQMMSSGRIARHRNYGDLMARHEREQKIKRFARLITYLLLVVFLLIIFFIIIKWERQQDQKTDTKPTDVSYHVQDDGRYGERLI